MKKLAILAKVLQSGIVAIVRTDNAEKAKKLPVITQRKEPLK